MIYRWSGFGLLLCLGLLLHGTVAAQSTGTAALSSLDYEKFPVTQVFLEVYNSQGEFVHGLSAEEVHVLEDNQPIEVDQISEENPGARMIVVLNPGPTFAVRNSKGVSRYDLLVSALGDWAGSRIGEMLDQWNLVTQDGNDKLHVDTPKEWLSALKNISLEAHETTPTYDPLNKALDLAQEPPPRSGMRNAVLLVTAAIPGNNELAVENILERAQELGMRIFVWLVMPPGAPISEDMTRLADLAQSTGGQFLTFTGEEALPDPSTYLDRLRGIYQISYTSRINQGAEHQVAVEIQSGEALLTTPPIDFTLEVLPPQPIFISPELEIVRKLPPSEAGKDWNEIQGGAFVPNEQPIHIVLEFPDGRPRQLVATRLLVDGEVVSENREEPFDYFTWDLSPYTVSGTHVLRVEAEDVLGLSGSSIDTFVQIGVEMPDVTAWMALSRHLPTIAVLLVVLSGAILLLVLVAGGRIQPTGKEVRRRVENVSSRTPVNQPAAEQEENMARHLPGWVNRLHWPQRHVAPQAFAFLSPISDQHQAASNVPTPIVADEITFGSDPRLATLVIDDPSVDELHARLIHLENGAFMVNDEDSIAGTWVNYTPVGREGRILEHGDLLHLGRAGYRFSIRQTAQTRKPIIIPIQSSKGSEL